MLFASTLCNKRKASVEEKAPRCCRPALEELRSNCGWRDYVEAIKKKRKVFLLAAAVCCSQARR